MSVGTHPARADSRTPEELVSHDVDTDGLRSKPLSEVVSQPFDYAISLCDEAAAEGQALSRCNRARDPLTWNFEDP